MAKGLARRPNFSNYTYKDEMIGNGVETVLKYIRNYDPNAVSKNHGKLNAYSYINLILWRAFGNQIKIEKRQHYYKLKSLELMGGTELLDNEDLDDLFSEKTNDAHSIITDMLSKCHEYEEKEKIKLEKAAKSDPKHPMFDLFTIE